ncbi:Leucine rich repeat containing protein BspA family protein [Entamoeba marina]
MQPNHLAYNKNTLDTYSLLIVSKYFKKEQDYINVICVCKKFKETTEKLRYNPIPITSLKLFPKIQTQYLYYEYEKMIDGIDNYEIWYEVDYSKYLDYEHDNIKCRYVKFTSKNKQEYGPYIPEGVTMLAEYGFTGSFDRSPDTVTIPNYVTSIGKGCFFGCSELKSIQLPNNLTILNDSCFSDCCSLKTINIESKIQSIGNDCFNNCSQLQTITIPSSVTKIGIDCFVKCESLTNLQLNTNTNIFSFRVSYHDSILYKQHGIDCTNVILTRNDVRNCKSELNTKQNKINYKIPNGINHIHSNAFSFYDKSIQTIEIPTTVTSLGGNCFEFCKQILYITIPNSVKLIGGSNFGRCSSLKNVKLSNNLTILPNSLFYECVSLELIAIPTSVKEFGYNCFSKCSSLKSLIIPNSVTQIKGSCFEQCKSIQEITIPSLMKELYYNSIFSDCSSLSKVVFPTTITLIGDRCFYKCSNLTTIKLPSSLKEIGVECFAGCGLQNIKLPTTITKIGLGCFEEFTNLTIPTTQTNNELSDYKSLQIENDPKLIQELGIPILQPIEVLTPIQENNKSKK